MLCVRRTQRLHQVATAAGRCADALIYPPSSPSSSSSSSLRSHRLSALHYAAMLPSRDRRHLDDVIANPGPPIWHSLRDKLLSTRSLPICTILVIMLGGQHKQSTLIEVHDVSNQSVNRLVAYCKTVKAKATVAGT